MVVRWKLIWKRPQEGGSKRFNVSLIAAVRQVNECVQGVPYALVYVDWRQDPILPKPCVGRCVHLNLCLDRAILVPDEDGLLIQPCLAQLNQRFVAYRTRD